MAQNNGTIEAGSRNRKWWLDPEHQTLAEQEHTKPVAGPSRSVSRPNVDEVMGFEEVTLNAQNQFSTEHTHTATSPTDNEDEDDDDLIVTNELTRVNSFDFVAGQAQENEANAAMADLINKSVRYETTSFAVIVAPVPAITNNRLSTQRYGAARDAEEIEMVERSRDSHAVDLEAARGQSERKKGGWMESLSLW
ncbi:hypothetical protein Slin15195_G019520 [Septoria linicola]|uniref:Uncharacterized protein n=1 Tax=Septoria linicola TaxID=215465 RepID=A0A9Q9EGU7_9PEZI|nr:hypothetical protein Slin15195_G019520 [Septoria linicola]